MPCVHRCEHHCVHRLYLRLSTLSCTDVTMTTIETITRDEMIDFVAEYETDLMFATLSEEDLRHLFWLQMRASVNRWKEKRLKDAFAEACASVRG